MIRSHLATLLWLRWRLLVNQLQRMGVPGALLGAVLIVVVFFTAVSTVAATLATGLIFLPRAEPHQLLFAWVGIVGVFLLCWLIGLTTDLQRAELLPMAQFMHLPVTTQTVFLINYLSSFFSLTLVIFLPAMFALAVAQIVAHGPSGVVLIPLVASFFLMVTAATYQLRGWLAGLMENRRRRRTVIALVTMSIVLLAQAPNIAHMTWRRARRQMRESTTVVKELNQALNAGEISQTEFNTKLAALAERRHATDDDAVFRDALATACQWLPPGWLPYGAQAASAGRVLPGLLGVAASLMITAVCLWRGYVTTLKLYRGEFQSGRRGATQQHVVPIARRRANWLEKRLPGVSDQAGAVAMANLRSLTRAPEAKMALLSPLLVFLIFGAMLYSADIERIPAMFRPPIALAIVWLGLTGVTQLTQNQFGYDRDGFRLLVLSPVERRGILLGKNLSVAPLGFGVTAIGLLLFQWLAPLGPIQFLATCVQAVSFFLVFCMTANLGSILAPMPTVAGARRKAQPNIKAMIMQFACALLTAAVTSPLAIPWGIDALLDYVGWLPGGWLYLVLSAIVLAGIVGLYPRVIRKQGNLLARRELAILQVVSGQG